MDKQERIIKDWRQYKTFVDYRKDLLRGASDLTRENMLSVRG